MLLWNAGSHNGSDLKADILQQSEIDRCCKEKEEEFIFNLPDGVNLICKGYSVLWLSV